MEIESFCIKHPWVEIIYCEPPAEHNTLLHAPHQLLDDYCSRTYSYTILHEYFNHQKDELEQQTYSTNLPTWLDSLTHTEHQAVAQTFVQYCQNLDLSYPAITFHS